MQPMTQASYSPTTRKLIEDIEAFRLRHDMTKTRFGIAAANDPNLVDDLENGREPRWQTVQRITEYMGEAAK